MQKYLFLILTLISLQVNGQSADIEAIKKQSREFSRLMVAGDYDAMLDVYTTDAKIFPANRTILEGEDLRSYWIPAEGAGSRVIQHEANPEEIKVLGNEAYDWGYYNGTSVNGDQESKWKGKYVIVWRKEDGEWKMYLDIWNRVVD